MVLGVLKMMNMSKLFLVLALNTLISIPINAQNNICPNTIYLEGKKDLKTSSTKVYQECINQFEDQFGDPWTFFRKIKISEVQESEYFQRILAAMFYLEAEKTANQYGELIVNLAPIHPQIFFMILRSNEFKENSSLTTEDIKNTDDYPVFSLILSIYKGEIDIYDAIQSEYFNQISFDVRALLLEPIVEEQMNKSRLDPVLLKIYTQLEVPDTDYLLRHDFHVTANGMYFALNSRQFELGQEIYKNFEKNYIPIDDSLDALVSWGWEVLALNKIALDDRLNIRSADEIISSRNKIIQSNNTNYHNWFWIDEDKRYEEALYGEIVTRSDIFLNLYDMDECDLALENFEPVFNAYSRALNFLEKNDLDLSDNKVRSSTYRPEVFFYQDDVLIEPVEAASCAIKEGKFEDALSYLDLSQRSIKYLKSYVSPVQIALLETTKLKYELKFNSLENNKNTYNKLVKKYNKESFFLISTVSKGYLNDLVNNIFFIYQALIELGASENELADPMQIYNLKFQFNEQNDLQNLFISYSEDSLSIDQLAYLEISAALDDLESKLMSNFTSEILEKIKDLSIKKNSLLENIYKSNQTLKSLSNPDYPNLKELKEHSYNNPIVLSNFGTSNSFIFLIQDGEYELFNSDLNLDEYQIYLKRLNKSIKNNKKDELDYDFDSAYILYKKIFSKMLAKVDSGKSLMIYGSELSGLPFWSLPQNEPTASDYLSNFLKANWLINDYSYAYFFPTSASDKENQEYENAFIGFGNPKLNKKFQLPAIPSAEDEMIQLALFSGVSKENIFLNNQATKNIFLSKLNQPTKRFAIGTHSVSFDPKNNIFQPSLLFAGEDSILSAADIINTKIFSEIILLTSCNTVQAVNNYNFTLLPRSFLVAGSNSVLFSNWNIESISTSNISKGIFKNLWMNDDLSIEESLRISVMESLKNTDSIEQTHPKFWAGIAIAYGNI